MNEICEERVATLLMGDFQPGDLVKILSNDVSKRKISLPRFTDKRSQTEMDDYPPGTICVVIEKYEDGIEPPWCVRRQDDLCSIPRMMPVCSEELVYYYGE